MNRSGDARVPTYSPARRPARRPAASGPAWSVAGAWQDLRRLLDHVE